jgi:hypothetical protein
MTPRRRFEYQRRTAGDAERHLRRHQKRQAEHHAFRGNCDRLCEMLREDDYDGLAAYFEAYKPRPRGKPPVDPFIELIRAEASGRERVARAQNGGELRWGERRLIANEVLADHMLLFRRLANESERKEYKRIFDQRVGDTVAYLERGKRQRLRRGQ